MRVRKLGKTGLSVSEMAVGTWGLSGDAYGPVDEATQERVLQRAFDMGFTVVETADAYGAGRMETLLGRVLRGAPEGVVVVTKGGVDRTTSPARKRFDREYLRGSIERSLRRIGRDCLDVYLLHNPSPAVLEPDAPEAVATLLEAKAEGKIRHWGVSVGDYEVGRLACRRGAEVIELAYNLLQPTDLHRLAGEIIVAGAGVLARSTLAYGMLSGTWSKDHDFAAGDHRANRWTKLEFERRLDQVAALRFLLGPDVHSLAGAAVRFVLSNTLVSTAVLGPRSVQQLEDAVRDVGMGPVYIRDSDLARIPRVLESVGIDP